MSVKRLYALKMKRDRKILLRVTEEDAAAFKKAAELEGRSMADYIRRTARLDADRRIRESGSSLPPEAKESGQPD